MCVCVRACVRAYVCVCLCVSVWSWLVGLLFALLFQELCGGNMATVFTSPLTEGFVVFVVLLKTTAYFLFFIFFPLARV